MKHRSDLKHTLTAKVRAEDREKKAIEGLRVIKDELRVVKEEFQAAREELCSKAAALDWASREDFEAESVRPEKSNFWNKGKIVILITKL